MNAFFILTAKYAIILPVIIIGIYFLTRPLHRWKSLLLFAVPVGVITLLLGLAGGHFFFDPRPFVVGHFTPLIHHAADNGFPSDHMLLASAIAVIGLFWDRWLGLLLWILALLIGFSRVYVGVHHPIDIIGSIVCALIAALIWYFIFRRIRERKAPPKIIPMHDPDV